MKDYFTVDNFYENPESVRKLAQNCSYVPREQAKQNFPGIESINSYYSANLVTKLQNHIDEKIVVLPEINAFGKFRLSIASDPSRTKVHIDNTNWSALIYLSSKIYCQGGTKIYKHRETGQVTFPNERELITLGLSKSEFDYSILLRDSLDDSKWEVIDEIEMKFNRCLFLRGDKLFHSSSHVFGNNFEDGRLTQNFFFDVG